MKSDGTRDNVLTDADADGDLIVFKQGKSEPIVKTWYPGVKRLDFNMYPVDRKNEYSHFDGEISQNYLDRRNTDISNAQQKQAASIANRNGYMNSRQSGDVLGKPDGKTASVELLGALFSKYWNERKSKASGNKPISKDKNKYGAIEKIARENADSYLKENGAKCTNKEFSDA